MEAGDAALAKSAMLDHLASVARWTLSTLHLDDAPDAEIGRPALAALTPDLQG